MNTASNAIANTLAIDPRGADRLRITNRGNSAAGAKAVAQQFEALLMQQMLASMRSATPTDRMNESSGVEMFRGMHDQQLTQMWSAKGGLGMADAIMRQIQVQQNPALLNQVNQKKPNLFLEAAGLSYKAATPAVAAKAAVGVPSVAAKVSGTASDFIGKLSSAAESTAASLGIAPHLLLAHAALETGWGKKAITNAAGQDSFNLFGIKAGSSWQGKTVDVLTTEFVDGVAQKRVEKFRAYDSYAESMADYASVMKRRFGEALAQGSDAIGFGKALAKQGYATDPQYGQKLARVANSVLARLDANHLRSGA